MYFHSQQSYQENISDILSFYHIESDSFEYSDIISRSGGMEWHGLSILHGSNSYKITFNKPLTEQLMLAEKAEDSGREGKKVLTLQAMICENELVIGGFICEGASEFTAKFSNGAVSFYSTPFAKAVEAGMDYQIPKNKTVRFEDIKMETSEGDSPVAVITCSH